MQAEVLRRNIQCLYHFTKIENLPSIMANGILPRGHLDNLGLAYQFNDEIRLDGHLGASSLSIEHPNYKMFWRLRMLSATQQWVVLGVQRNILWEKDCAFCHENAASAQVTSIPIAQRRTLQAFNNMFAEVPNKPTRAALRLQDKFPTNPQAEVLVFDVIEPRYLVSVVTNDFRLVPQLRQDCRNVHVVNHPHYFSARFDHQAW